MGCNVRWAVTETDPASLRHNESHTLNGVLQSRQPAAG